MNTQILLVEDDLDLADTIISFASIDGIEADFAADGVQALNLARDNRYHVIVLDLQLPRKSGLEVCQTLRAEGNATPIIMLTAQSTLQDKLTGFERGADDYLTKPFDLEELMARIKVLSLRKSGQAKSLSVAHLCLDTQQKQLKVGERGIKLSKTQFNILEALMRQHPNPVAASDIEYAIWGDDVPESNSLNVHLFHLRKLLKTHSQNVTLHNQSGFGYHLLVEGSEEHNSSASSATGQRSITAISE